MVNLLLLLASLCIAEFVHNVFEIWGIRFRVKMLGGSLQGGEYGDWPIKLNSKFQIALLHIVILIVSVGLSFFILNALHLKSEQLIITGIIVLVMNYFHTTFVVDRYHTEIGKLFKN